MKISLNWLKNYVDINVPVEALCDKMVMAGFEVESIENLAETMNNVIVGRITKLEKHPDADKLQICTIDVGAGTPVQIVTGADNIFEGAVVPVAMHKSKLPNGQHITKGKLRGVESCGMLCSGGELCIKDCDYEGAEVNGILILRDEYELGTDMREVLGLNDYVIDFKITANRPDCQSVLGVAREVGVVLNTPFKMPDPVYKTAGGNINSQIKVTVKDYVLCPRYIGRVVKNLRVKPSPEWLKRCVKAAGMRPINNIVDITNYVMLETGQPMHAFDKRDIRGNEIIVRRAENGETITTLDEKNYVLNSEMLVIADGSAPSCLAGIMGGLNSEIKPDTTELFLESAKFKRDNVRRTSRALGIRTESSGRFERGIDVMTTEYAMNRALQLIDALDAGDIVDGTIDCYEKLPEKRVVLVEAKGINALLGLEIPFEVMAEILNRLCIRTTLENGMLTCEVPSYRDDIEGRADLAEEVMRIYGYDHIVGTTMRGNVVRGTKKPGRIKTEAVKSALCSIGMREITTYSFISSKAINTLFLDENDERRREIAIRNPLGEEYSMMRTQLITSMLTVFTTNISRGNEKVRLFEVSQIFKAKDLPLTEQPDEIPAITIGVYGKDEDFFTAKGAVERILNVFSTEFEFERSHEPYLHPGRQAAVIIGGKTIGYFGEVHPKVGEIYGFNTRAYVGEIRLDALFALEKKKTVYNPLPKHPAVTRDLALICDRSLPVAVIEKTIKEAAGNLLETVTLFDVYQGGQIDADKKSVAYSMTLRASDRTLTDEESAKTVEKVIKALEGIGATLRK